MKKLIIIIIGCLLVLAIWYGEKRKFYPIGNNKFVTVWKTYNNVCYIIPDKYYGIVKPSANFLKTSNDNYVVLFFTQELPSHIIFWEGRQGRNIEVDNKSKEKVVFVDYLSNKDSLHSML